MGIILLLMEQLLSTFAHRKSSAWLIPSKIGLVAKFSISGIVRAHSLDTAKNN